LSFISLLSAEKRAEKREEKYTIALLCGKIRLWDIPRRERRGEYCRCYYITAYRFARDSGKGRSYFQEYLAFLEKELRETRNAAQYKNLLETQRLLERYVYFPGED